jgi:lysophospholipase L1-like esterase
MKNFGNQSFLTKLLLATNIMTVILLVVISFTAGYPQKICRKLSRANSSEYNYKPSKNWEQKVALYQLYQGQKNIVMLGSSLTAGVIWAELLNRPEVATRGIGGDVTAGQLARLPYIINLKPKICFIQGTANDLGQGISQEVIIKNLTLMVDTLQTNGIIPVLMTVTLTTNKSSRNQQIKELNKKISKLAQENNVKLIDLNQYVSDGDFLLPEYAVEDGVHFTETTYLIWKQEVEKILEEENI